jgi:hypothetical protein
MMRLRHLASVALVMSIGLCVTAVHVIGQAPDALTGTWTLDAASSKFSPGPAPKSITLKFEDTADGVKHQSDLVTADGQPVHQEFTVKADGKDHPVVGSPAMDTVALTRKGNTRTRVDKKGGKVVMDYNAELSADGKTFTVQQKGTNPEGKAVSNTLVFVKKT